MRLLFFLVWKNWASSPLRILLTWLGVTLGVAIVTAVHVLDHNTILSQLERNRGDFGRVDFELRPRSPDRSLDEVLATLRDRPDLSAVGVLAQTGIRLSVPGRPEEPALLFGPAPVGGDTFGHYRVGEGRDLSPLGSERDVLIGGAVARRLGLRPGDRVLASALPIAAITDCVDGRRVPRSASEPAGAPPSAELVVRGILEPFRIARQGGGRVVVGSFALVTRLGRRPSPVIQITRRPGTDPDRLRAALREAFVIEDRRSALIGENADERAFRNGVKVIGCLALVLGMFVIFHTLSHALAEKIRRVGILRALGATEGQVAAIFLLDAIAISLLGALGGLGGGVLLAEVFRRGQITTLGLGKTITTFELPWTTMLSIGGLGVVFTMLGAAFPLQKVRRLDPCRILYVRDLAPPADLMRGVHVFMLVILVVALPLAYLAMTPLLQGEGRGAGTVLLQLGGIVALLFGVFLLSPRLLALTGGLPLRLVRGVAPLAAFLVRKNLLRSPGRLATAVCGLTAVALAMLGLAALTSALRGDILAFSAEALDDRVFIRVDPRTPLLEADLAAIRAVPGVQSVAALHGTQEPSFRMVGMSASALLAPGAVFAGRPDLARELREGRGLVISRRFARLRGLTTGQNIPVALGRRVVQYRVLAVSDRDGFFPDERTWALTDRHWIENDFCVDLGRIGECVVRLAPGADPGPVIHAMHARRGDAVRADAGASITAHHLADVDRDFLFFDILLYLLLVLAGIGQVNLITLTTLARTREIGVLEALGMTAGGYLKVLLLEAAVIGFVTALMTVLAGLPMTWVLIRGLGAVSGLDAPWIVPWAALAWVAVLAFLVSLVATILPAVRAARVPATEAVRSTE